MDPTQDENLCRAIRENEVGPTTHLWMTAYPDKDTSGPKPYRALNVEDFRSAYRCRLDIVDPHLGALCKLGTVKCGFCEKELSAASSLHLSDCTSRGRGITRRHHALRDELKEHVDSCLHRKTDFNPRTGQYTPN